MIMSTASRDYHEDEIRAGLVGAMMGDDPVKANELQKIAVEESRLGIPLIMGYDVIHGLRTVYPIAIAEAGTFDEDLFERTAKIAAKESRANGIEWNFAPMLDVARDARWGRVSEGPGEDPYLASRFARCKIRGLQNDQSSTENYVAACVKHFVAYSACESGRDYNTTSMSVSQLHNVYLPPFKAAVEEGAASAMASFNDLNGVPCTVNRYTLRETLKNRYGMNGFVVSDANGVAECVTHGIAEDSADAGIQAMNAGLDMDMGSHVYKDFTKAAIENGQISMETLDDAVRRILSVKMWLGLFENPYVPEENIEKYKTLPEEHVAISLEAAEKSIVLLKNEDQVLPLDKTRKISLVGTLAANENEVCGAWAMGCKLASSFPAVNGQCPIYYNHPSTGRPGSNSKFTSRYLDAPFDALYPFGYGLSYTSFTYGDMQVKETADSYEVSVPLKNTGDRDGTEIVQLYMQDVTASLVRPVRELKGFARADLKSGEERTVTISLKKADMGFYDNQGQYVLESGLFRLFIGTSSRECQCREVRTVFE